MDRCLLVKSTYSRLDFDCEGNTTLENQKTNIKLSVSERQSIINWENKPLTVGASAETATVTLVASAETTTVKSKTVRLAQRCDGCFGDIQ